MDPISQGTVGAAFAQSTANKKNILSISLIGFLAGLAPDLDVLIRSSTDPILFLEYHRQFSHSLFFIPFGALIVALFLYPLFRKSISLKTVYLASFLGYATHGLLDACTSYGTLLFWPFSNERVTWNNISIVDPLFTIPILILAGTAIKTRKRLFSYFAIGWVAFYLSLGFVQYDRAFEAANKLALSRGHNPERLTLKPSFGNLILWKSIYQHEGKLFMLMPFEPFNHQPGVWERVFEYLTINFICPILKKTASKERILKDFVGFHRIIWALMKRKIWSQMFVTQ